jgi:hypothetical protein
LGEGLLFDPLQSDRLHVLLQFDARKPEEQRHLSYYFLGLLKIQLPQRAKIRFLDVFRIKFAFFPASSVRSVAWRPMKTAISTHGAHLSTPFS